MLRGNALATIDEKGRLKLPSAFRSALEAADGAEFFVTSLRGDAVRIYPLKTWEAIEARLARQSSLSPSIIRFRKTVNYYGQVTSMDAQGRILLHPLVRERAGTRGEVAVLGQHDYLEVWDRAVFEDGLAKDPLTDADLDALSRMGI